MNPTLPQEVSADLAAEASPPGVSTWDQDGSPGAASLEPELRKRPKRGERRLQILHTVASMLEQPGVERVTTAALASRIGVSEAALYRHFASKSEMFEGLIEFIEHTVFTLANQIQHRHPPGMLAARHIVDMLMQFSERNPGMTRVMVGDALVFESEHLVVRMGLFFDRLESQLRQTLRTAAAEEPASSTPTVDANVLASILTAFVVGRMQRFARSGFKRSPTEHLELVLQRLCGPGTQTHTTL